MGCCSSHSSELLGFGTLLGREAVRRGYVSTFRITVRGDDVELRGFIRDYGNLEALADAVKPYGWFVIGSVAEYPDDSKPVELFQAQWRESKPTPVTIEHHLARLLDLISQVSEGSRLTIAHKDGEGAGSWVVAVEREGEDEVVRTAETMAEAIHEADAAASP